MRCWEECWDGLALESKLARMAARRRSLTSGVCQLIGILGLGDWVSGFLFVVSGEVRGGEGACGELCGAVRAAELTAM